MPDREKSPPVGKSPQTLSPQSTSSAPGKAARTDLLPPQLERSVGTGVRDVDIQTGPEASAEAREHDAFALALVDRVVVSDELQPGPERDFIVAHEIAHVVQQGGLSPTSKGPPAQTGGDHESQADQMAERMLAGVPLAPAETISPRIQRWNRRAEQRRQRWGAQPLEQLGTDDSSIEPAIAANRELGFTQRNIQALRQCLGFSRGTPIIDRRFVEAVQRAQAGQAVVDLDLAARNADGERAMGVPSQSGILAESIVRGLRFRARLAGNPRRFYNRGVWGRMSAGEFTAARAQLITVLGVGEADITRNSRGRIRVTPNFRERAALWQLWRFRSQAIAFGNLGLRALDAMGVPHPATRSPAAAPEPDPSAESGADAEGAEAPTPASREGATTHSDESIASEDRAAEQEVTELTPDEVRERITAAQRRVRRVPRDAADWADQFEAIRRDIEALRLPRTNFERSRRFPRRPAQAGRLIAELEYIADEESMPQGDRERAARRARAEVPAESSPLVRRGAEESREHLEEEGVIAEGVDPERSARGWGARVTGGRAGGVADTADVRRRAIRNARTFRELRGQLEGFRADIEASISSGDYARIYGSLEDILAADFARPGWEPPHSARNERLRRAWSPGQRPSSTMPANEGGQRQLANRWRAWLRSAVQGLGDENRGEIERNAQYATIDPTTITVEDPVAVDFHATGVTVANNVGNALPVSEMRLNAQFADAFLRFLRELQGLGVSEIWTSGFYRQPLSPDDTHPKGRACDITGFVVGSELIHLRSGRPQRRPDESDSSAMAEYNRVSGGHSDWFDHDDPPINGQTHEQILHGITNRMRSYFSSITGPGNDGAHMGHWHVQLTGGSRPVQVLAQHLDESQSPANQAAWDRREPGWRTAPENERRGDVPARQSDE